MKVLLSIFLCLLMFPDSQVAAITNSPLPNPVPQVGLKSEVAQSDNEKVGEAPAPSFPDRSEVWQKALELTKNADSVRTVISASTQAIPRTSEIGEAEGRFKELQASISTLSEPGNWDTSTLADANSVILKEKRGLEALEKKFSATLAQLESIRHDWEKQQTYWWGWRDFLNTDGSETLMETFNASDETIRKILADLTSVITDVFAIKERVSRLLAETIKLSEIGEAAFSRERTSIFKKNATSLFNTDFYAQFNAAFWRSVWDHRGQVEDLPDSRSVWKIAARIFIALFLALLVICFRKTEPMGGERVFLLHHPWALGIFLSEALSIVFWGQPTGLARDFSSSLFAFSSLILVSASLNMRLEPLIICFLAALVTVPGILKMVPLPNPLFRLYWAGTTLAGTFLFTAWARQLRHRALPGKKFFLACLGWGAVVMALAAVAQITGFVSFSEKVVLSTIRIAFLVAGVILLLKINRIMMALLLEHSFISNWVFLRHFGKVLGQRLTTLLNSVVCGIAFFFFLSIIGAYSSAGKAFEVLLLSQITIGNLSLSPALALLAALILYLSSFTSWIVRAILESQIFPRMQVDEGAGQSVTKLLHYFLIFLGLLISMSMLGIDLKSFAVLGGALGVGIGFGLRNIVNDFISGLILLFERPVRVGDRIEADSQIGIVKNIGLRATVVETLDQSQLIVPNSKLVSENVTNWTHSGTVARLKIPVGVAYESDIDLVFDKLIGAALSSSRVLKTPKPIALLLGFGQSCLNMELHVWLTDVNQTRQAQSEISREILRRFAESKIAIPFPQQEVRLRYEENAQPIGVLPETK